MAETPKTFDVWFLTANTVYKGVPYHVVAEWVRDGRLAAADRVRPAGSQAPWDEVGRHDLLRDYLPRRPVGRVVSAAAAGPAVTAPSPAPAPQPWAGEDLDLPEPEPAFLGPREAEDEDVDMVPLIDISMVLLVFFIMMRAAAALAPIDVPEMRYAGELRTDPEAITIGIDKQYDPAYPGREEYATVRYSVRRGAGAPRPGHDHLETPEQAVAALDELLAGATRPPEVRIACHKSLPYGRVLEIQAELEPRFRKGLINSYVATVVEAPKP